MPLQTPILYKGDRLINLQGSQKQMRIIVTARPKKV